MINYDLAIGLGFEIFAEVSDYTTALLMVADIMNSNKSNCCYIFDRISGDTPYKIMIIPYSLGNDKL